LKMRKKFLWLIIWGSGLFLCSVQAWNAQASEWTLKVSVAEARIRLKPDPFSPTLSVVPKGTILKSFAREGEWFRVITEPGREGFVAIGYVLSNEVEVVEEKTLEEPDSWEEVSEEYRGAGISLRLGAGFFFFQSGDIERGVSGMFDETADVISSLGPTVEEIGKKSMRSGYDISGDIIYNLNSRIGVGIRFNYTHASQDSFLRFNFQDPSSPYTMWNMPRITSICISPQFYYAYPLSRILTLVANGGPALYLVDYEFGRKFVIPSIEEDIHQKVKANSLGFQGGIGLEFRLNPRVDLFMEAQGRYGKISNFEGNESTYKSWHSQIWTSNEDGFLYYEEGEQYPRLVVLSEESAGVGDVRKAVLNFSGVSLAAGFRIKF
jgi:hypothetical protein